MRGFLVFAIVLAAFFFGIGEWKGWMMGILGQVPVMVYKSEASATAVRRTVNRQDMPFSVQGTVKNGTVRVEGYFEVPKSFQSGKAGKPEKLVFEEEFSKGETISLNETLKNGQGEYRIVIKFDNATGIFKVGLPKGIEL
jgi:hypothetical protein